jgi:Ion channel
MPEQAAADRRARERYGLLLAVLIASFAVQGTAPTSDFWRGVVTVLLGAALILAFLAADMPARRLRIAGLLVVFVVAAALFSLLIGLDEAELGFTAIANALLVALAPPSIVAGVIRSLRAHHQVTVQVLFGVLCLYLLVGMFFAFLYAAIEQVSGDPFFSAGLDATPARSIYFSFTTLTTVGYGDVTAASNVGHTLAVTEALLGQIYLVTVVSVVVANLVPRRFAG